MANLSTPSLPPTWGIRPILWEGNGLRIESYPFFVSLALATGLLVFWLLARRERTADERSFFIILAALAGGAIGAKLPVWIFHAREIAAAWPDVSVLLSGRTIVGGLIGGTLAVWWLKRKLKIHRRIGNAIAPAAALGIAIGRIGCFLRGCCYGLPTSLPWGVNVGDGIARHPTQLYESLFALTAFTVLLLLLRRKPRDGVLFTGFVAAYFAWRFLLEFLRVEPRIFLSLTGYQWASLGVLLYLLLRLLPPLYERTFSRA